MDTSNIVRVVEDFGSYVLTTPVKKEDVGIKLIIDDIELPEFYEIDFSNSDKKGKSTTVIGDSTGVEIPVKYIKTGKAIYAFYYYVEPGFGRTVRIYHIPNKVRPDRDKIVPEEEQLTVIDQAIAALNTAVVESGANADRAEQAAANAGWVEFYIDDDGYLHYVKSDNVGLDFYIDDDGYLHVVMEE